MRNPALPAQVRSGSKQDAACLPPEVHLRRLVLPGERTRASGVLSESYLIINLTAENAQAALHRDPVGTLGTDSLPLPLNRALGRSPPLVTECGADTAPLHPED